MHRFEVPEGCQPLRLDVFVARALPAVSRRLARQAIAAGTIRVNGRRTPKGCMVVPGDVVCVDETVWVSRAVEPDPGLDVPILYADEALVAIDKPAGVPSHVLRPGELGTVANFLVARFPGVAAVGGDPREAGLVHRLDTDTSGVLLAARTAAAWADLRRQFTDGRVDKEYLAIVVGSVRGAGEVRVRVMHDPRDPRRMRCTTALDAGRPALTRYRPVRPLAGYTLLAVEIRTGVRHQIRVHLAAIGHAVVGDRLYGAAAETARAERHLLHATRLVFAHPVSGRVMTIDSVMPADMAAFVAAHEAGRPLAG